MPKNKWDLGPRVAANLTERSFKKLIKQQGRHREDDIFYTFGVFLKNGELIGDVGLMDVSRRISQSAFLGYRIYNPYWGYGYAKKAVCMAIDIGFRDVRLHRLEAGIEPENRRSIALAKSLKMRREGLKKEPFTCAKNGWTS
ncbi:MAG: GNAT family N-acetyltransferase [Pseudobdellovibrionaceae bacterium]